MGRPRRTTRGNPKLLEPLVALQARRFSQLVSFCEAIESPEAQAAAEEDDVGFKDLIHLSVVEYGVQQSRLAERLKVSAAQVCRMADPDRRYFPPPYERPQIMKEIGAMLREHIDAERVRQAENDTAGTVTILRGRIR